MSLSAMVWALNQDIRNASAKLLLISLGNYADEDGKCWPSIDRLAKDCSASRQTIMNATKRLVEMGAILTEKRTGGSNFGAKSILYTLNTESPKRTESRKSKTSKAKVQSINTESQRIRPEPIKEPIKEPITKKQAKKPFSIPPGLNMEAWSEFEEHRKSIRKPMTDLARTKAAKILCTLGHEEQQSCVDKSIQSGWSGLFPDKVRVAAVNKADALWEHNNRVGDDWVNSTSGEIYDA